VPVCLVFTDTCNEKIKLAALKYLFYLSFFISGLQHVLLTDPCVFFLVIPGPKIYFFIFLFFSHHQWFFFHQKLNGCLSSQAQLILRIPTVSGTSIVSSISIWEFSHLNPFSRGAIKLIVYLLHLHDQF
jgi:hypothetical protein